jgi:hypothetical protein
MKNYCLIVLCVLMSLPALGQSTDVNIEKQEAACYARFAVNDCLRKVRAQRRAARDIQRHKEIELKDAERKEKAQEALERLKQKSSDPG